MQWIVRCSLVCSLIVWTKKDWKTFISSKEKIVDNENKISPLLEIACYTENATENNFISLKYEIICEDVNSNEYILYNSIIENNSINTNLKWKFQVSIR